MKVLLALSLWLAPGAVMLADEPAAEFFQQLRAAGYYDTAERYLDRLDEYPGVDPEFRSAVELERAHAAIDAALAARRPTDRDEQFARAEEFLKSFLGQDDHPRSSEARLLLGTIQMSRAQQLLLGDVDDRQRAAARDSYLAAAKTYDTIIEQLRQQLTQMQGARIDPEKEPEKVALRDRYRNDFLNAQLQSGNARYRAAMTFANPGEEGKSLLEQALEQFTSLYKDFGSKYVQGAMAMAYQGKVQQALGQNAQALDSYLRMVEQGDAAPLRDSKLEAVSGMIELWLAEQPPKYAPAIDRGQAMVSSLRPNEKDSPVAQQLRVNLAKAYLAKAQDKDAHNPTEQKRAEANGRRLLNEAKRVPGEHADETETLLAGLGIEPTQPELPTAEAPKSIEEAVDGARQIMESVQSLEQTAQLLRDQGEKSDEVAERVAQIETEKQTLRTNGTMLLRRGLGLAKRDTDPETITQARQLLTYLLYQQGRYREAAVVGGFVARSSPGTEVGLRNGLLALNAMQLLITQAGAAGAKGLIPHVERLGTYLATTWPNDPEAAAARGVMVQLALTNDRWEEAEQLIDAMPDGPEKARFQRLLGQLTWNRSLTVRREGDDEQADMLLDAAIASLQTGLKGISGKLVAPEAMQSALILAKAQLRKNNEQAALQTLDHPDYGPTQLVGKVDAPSEAFPADLYSTELQAVVGRMTAPDSDSDALLARAEASMQKLRESVSGPDSQSRLLGILVRLARDIREQIDTAAPNQKQNLIDAFRVFVDRIAESSADVPTLQWVGSTLLQMGESLNTDDTKATGQAETLIRSAAKAFQDVADRQDDPSLTIRYQLARSYRLVGEYKQAIDELAAILGENPNMLDAQVEAALAYEQWAAEVPPQYRGRAYQSALVGARRDASGNNVVWGWGKISQMTSRDPKFRERFFDARYHVALCRFLMGRAMKDAKVIEKAISDITTVASLYPDLGGPEQKRKFDVLLKQIQREAGKSATGLP